MKLFIFALLLLGVVLCSGVSHPHGMTMRFTNLALEKVHEKFIDNWRNLILKGSLPSIEGDNYLVNFKVRSIDVGTSAFELSPPDSVIIAIKDEGFKISADWMYLEKKREHSGTAVIKVNGVNVKQQMLFNITENNEPMLVPGACEASIDEFKLKISATDPFTSLLFQMYVNMIEVQIEAMICDLTSREMLSYLHYLFPVTPDDATHVHSVFSLYPFIHQNIAQSSVPVVSNDDIKFFFDGTCYSSVYNPEQTVPFEILPPPTVAASQKMVQLVIGEYVFQTLNYALFQEGVLDGVESIELLNEHFGTNLSPFSLSQKLPEFSTFVNSSLTFLFTYRFPPKTRINSTGIYTTEEKRFCVRAAMEDGTEEIVVKLDYVNEIQSQLYVIDDVVHMRIEHVESVSFENTPTAEVFNQFQKEHNLNFTGLINDNLASEPYITLQYGPYQMEQISITLLEGGIDFAADIGYNTTQDLSLPIAIHL